MQTKRRHLDQATPSNYNTHTPGWVPFHLVRDKPRMRRGHALSGQFPQGLLFGLAHRQQLASQQGRFSLADQDRRRSASGWIRLSRLKQAGIFAGTDG